jgi:protoporphyrinogen oxidase
LRIGIIGGGVTGIAEALYLAQKGHKVVLYEKQKILGGLAAWFNIGGRDVERYYHFIMTCDKHYLDLLDELGLTNQLNWVETTTAFYHQNNIYPFSEPMHLLKFAPLSFPERVRLAGLLAYMTKISKNWRPYEDRQACEWLPKWGGRKAWEVIFAPMLDMKFGTYRDQMTMAWLWARFNMVGQYREEGSTKEKRAWVKGSSRTFIEAAEKKLLELGVEIHKGADIQNIEIEDGRAKGIRANGNLELFDKVVFSASSTALPGMLPESTKDDPYFKMIYDQKYYGVTCLVASLKKKFNPYFWTYVSDPKIPFVGVINYTDFTSWEGQPGHNVIYIPWYSDVNQEPYTTPKEEIIKTYFAGLKKVQPAFDESWVDEVIVGRDPTAAMVCTGRYSDRLVPLKTPIKDFVFSNLSQIYPQDRGISPGIKLARYAIRTIETGEDVKMDFSPFASTEHIPV